ncbi:hypothetical protein O3P69_003970 [Scylla paramamosain]|uniref:Protein vein n=1 Tax=Scylla paramamosain TaxID=85552 RepID=A0AAW0UG83_SCYPA
MKAPCCLLGAAALPRPPERASGTPRPARGSAACRASYTCMLCVCWVVLVVVTRASAYAACPVRTDARDVASKAYVSPQVVEAVVREVGPRVPGRPYTVTVTVNKKLRGYRGRARVKKRDILTLTFRYPLADTDGGFSAEESDSDGDCLVSAALQPRHKYLLFLSGSNERGAEPLPVAPPETASRKLRRLVRKTVCKNCAQAPRVRGLQDDSVVEGYNLTLECSAEGLPPPELVWYKDGAPLTSGRHVRVRSWTKRLKKRRKSLGRHARSPAVVGVQAESNGRRRPPLRSLRRRHDPSRHASTSEAVERRRASRGVRRGRKGKIVAEDSERDRRRRQGKREERRRRIGRDGRRRILPTNDDDASSPATRRRQADAERQQNPSSSRRWNKDSDATPAGGGSKKSGRRGRRPITPSQQRVVQVSEVKIHDTSRRRDAGQYKCVARSVVGEAEIEANIRVVRPINPHTLVEKCPYDGYCLNGGTCMMFTVVGELVCQCAEGFKGQRCQEKEVYPTFNRNCHGPIRNLRHSQGRRCPRNQPAALWELLQQTLALRRQHKVTPWTKTQLLLWPTARPRAVTWPP